MKRSHFCVEFAAGCACLVVSFFLQVKVHIDITKKVNEISLHVLNAELLPLSGVTDKMASLIAKQRKVTEQSGVGTPFPTMCVPDFLPPWAMVGSMFTYCMRLFQFFMRFVRQGEQPNRTAGGST